jgi:hypothetical protein
VQYTFERFECVGREQTKCKHIDLGSVIFATIRSVKYVYNMLKFIEYIIAVGTVPELKNITISFTQSYKYIAKRFTRQNTQLPQIADKRLRFETGYVVTKSEIALRRYIKKRSS